jgi:hypothetical protein
MKLVLFMGGISWLAWVPTLIWSSRQTSVAVLAGMIGPLLAVSVTWMAAERTYHRRPQDLTTVMIVGFAGKVLFFLAYVGIMIRVLSLRPGPFVASFITYFIVLYFVVALSLQRLFSGEMN